MCNADDEICHELGSGEQVLWAGHPRCGLRLQLSDLFLIPFSLLWGGFAIFWEVTAIQSGAPFFFVLWGVPFVLIGLHLIFGRFFLDAEQRDNTTYAVTNERILIVSGVFSRKVESLDLKTLTDLSLTEYGNGAGRISFGHSSWLEQFNLWGWPGMGLHNAPAFVLTDGARRVYELIREAQSSARRRDAIPDSEIETGIRASYNDRLQ